MTNSVDHSDPCPGISSKYHHCLLVVKIFLICQRNGKSFTAIVHWFRHVVRVDTGVYVTNVRHRDEGPLQFCQNDHKPGKVLLANKCNPRPVHWIYFTANWRAEL